MKLLGEYHVSNTITFLGIAAAILGIYAAGANSIRLAVVCLICAGLCDMTDGMFARGFQRTDRQKAFGVQLDSFADIISFVALPIAIAVSREHPLVSWYTVIACIIYAFAAVTRLSIFNISADLSQPVKYYRGLPVTYAALIFSLFFTAQALFLKFGMGISDVGTGISDVGADVILRISEYGSATLFIVVAFFFVLDTKVLKPRGGTQLVFFVIAAALIVVNIVI